MEEVILEAFKIFSLEEQKMEIEEVALATLAKEEEKIPQEVVLECEVFIS